ncbi:MAG: 3-dehydro-L-gulonate 2-dehydrogenase [Bacteroidota bacterium]|nr:3-dehydro-L-gulonate 2-dehydrogenase [Bacteroidota bacterium]
MRISYSDLKVEFKRILRRLSFNEEKAELCATIFADNSLDGIYSHGINRFPAFVQYVKDGLIDVDAEPTLEDRNGLIERWDGHCGPGMYNATLAMDRAIHLAKENGMGAVALRNTTHWMRGGTYGWQAAAAGCIGICFTNTIANMPPWGGTQPRIGNNPLVISIPHEKGHVVLDMAMSQFSYGKLYQYDQANQELPVYGGYDDDGFLTTNATAIIQSGRVLPIGYWKGSALSLVLDMLLTSVTGGLSVQKISEKTKETGISQFFLCLNQSIDNEQLMDEIIRYTKSSELMNPSEQIRYPGESILEIRHRNQSEGIPVNDQAWAELLDM